MKLKNTTSVPDYFLRRMTSWCCKQLGVPVRKIRKITFRNKSGGYSGHCYPASGIIVVSTTPERVPKMSELTQAERVKHQEFSKRVGRPELSDPVRLHTSKQSGVVCERSNSGDLMQKYTRTLRHRIDDLVAVTAHEVAHRMQYLENSNTRRSRKYNTVTSGGSERRTVAHERIVKSKFMEQADQLIEQWSVPPQRTSAAARPSRKEKNEQRARAALKRWEKKLKLARTKVRKYKAAVARYERETK